VTATGPGPLDGKTALVTGAARGIGEAIARRLAEDGADLAITDIRAEAVAETAVRLSDVGGGVADYVMDVTDERSVREAVDAVVDRFGHLDIVVNNAGIRLVNPFLEQDLSGWRATLDVNLTGVFIVSKAAIPHMLAAGGGKIVNIASVSGELALTERAAYIASKAGVAGLTKAMAFELSSQGINVNAVSPGPIETPLTAPYYRDEAMVAILRKEIPRGSWGVPEDIADAVAFLAGPRSGYICGAILAVDGGWITGKGY
jgi:NAD(P)-dependent dehydrogenase (short-subunit alcohol dehydrogenase family)